MTIISNIIAFISAVISLAAFLYSSHLGKEANRINATIANDQRRIRDLEHSEQIERDRFNNELAKLTSSETIIPYFYLNLQDQDIEIEGKRKVLGIRLTNVGLATAVNIQLVPIWPEKVLMGYIRARNGTEVGVCEYLTVTAARVDKDTKFKIRIMPDGENIADEFTFKMKYSDIAGREYEQEFAFLYDSIMMPTQFNLNNTSFKPVLVKDVVN